MSRFSDNENGTITDTETHLTWFKQDSRQVTGKWMHLEKSEKFAQDQNAAKFGGHDDWRVPKLEDIKTPEEEYLGSLYDIGFDKPETHVIKKDDTMYYAFYDKAWSGAIELRGLEKGENYTVFDYVNNVEIAKINGDNPVIDVKFNNYLLVEVYQK